ncbi:hypothetical protein [Nocardia sp. IFM 10818]
MMKKLFSGAVLTATAATLLVLPAAPAQAASPVCDKAIAMINAAVDMSGGTFDTETQQKLADRLSGLAVVAVGPERDAITAYANALVDENVTDMDGVTAELNRVCA